MKLSVQTSSTGTVEQILASHLDKGVREQACRESGALSYDVSIESGPDGRARVQVDRLMAPDVADYIRKFVGETISIRQVEEWGPANSSSARSAVLRLTIKGQPASMVGSVVITPEPTGATEVITGDVKVAIPLLGRKIEPEIVKVVEAGLRLEQRISQDWVRANY
jgi:hypothetical protein